LKIQECGGRHLEKSKNRHMLATVRRIAVKFGVVTPSSTIHYTPDKNKRAQQLLRWATVGHNRHGPKSGEGLLWGSWVTI